MNEELMLLSLIPGLEAAKRAIEQQIENIRQQTSSLRIEMVPQKKTRHSSEEVKQQRRALIMKARLVKLNNLRAEKGLPLLNEAGEEEKPKEAPQKVGAKSRDGTGQAA